MLDSSQLDFEMTLSFTLDIEVTDNGSPNLSDTATITIDLNNVNEAPGASDDTFLLDENVAFGTSVRFVSASDPDSDPLMYSITGGNSDGVLKEVSSGSRFRRDDRPTSRSPVGKTQHRFDD